MKFTTGRPKRFRKPSDRTLVAPSMPGAGSLSYVWSVVMARISVKFAVSIFIFSSVLLCGCVSPNRQLVTSRPERWDAQLSTNGRGKRQFLVEIHDYGQGYTEFVIRRGERGKSLLAYETLHVSKLSESDLRFLYDAILQTLQDFRFTDDALPDRLDGGYATVELRIGSRSLSAGFSSFGDTAELPSSVQRIMKFADSKLANHPGTKR
jgi:hypothetical protein